MATAYFFLKVLKRRQQKKFQKREDLIVSENDKASVSKCRICLKDGSLPIFGPSTDLPEAVRTFGDIDLHESDDYPKYLCNTCYSHLQSAILFRKCAKEAEGLLRHSSTLSKQSIDIEKDDTSSEIANDYEYDSSKKCSSHKCKLCRISFQTLKEYLAHQSSKQHRNVRIQCSVCNGLLTPQLYKKHLARHESASHLICDVCGKLYRKDNLVRHMQLHSSDLPYQCQICPYRGKFRESLKLHMRTHTGDKRYSCDKCQLRFLTRSNLNRHLLTHIKDKPFKCIECGRGFYLQRDMDVHYKSDHAGIKDFDCSVCGNKFATKKSLMRHELKVHKRDKLAKGRMPLYLQEEYQK